MRWNYNMNECPLDTPICLLSEDGFLFPQQQFIGILRKKNNQLCKGECIKGNAKYFYISKLVAWGEMAK